MRLARAVVVLQCLLAAACSAVTFTDQVGSEPQNATQAAAETQAPVAALDESTVATTSSELDAENRVVSVPRPKPKPEPEQPDALASVDPTPMKGLTRDEVRAKLGEPSLVEDQAPAKIWVYHTGACVLRVIYFLDIQDQLFRVVSLRAETSGRVTDATGHCLAVVLNDDETLEVQPASGE